MHIGELRKGFIIGEYTVYPLRQQLVSDNGIEEIEPKVMEVFVFMASRAGEVIARRAFHEELWTNSIVGDECLTRCISLLRKALGDTPRAPQYVRTVNRIGYELLRQPRPLGSGSSALAPSGAIAPEMEPRAAIQVFSVIRRFLPIRMVSACAVAAWVALKLVDLVMGFFELPSGMAWQAGLLIIATAPMLAAIAWIVRARRLTQQPQGVIRRLPAALILAGVLGWLALGIIASQSVKFDGMNLAGISIAPADTESVQAGPAKRAADKQRVLSECGPSGSDSLTAATGSDD